MLTDLFFDKLGRLRNDQVHGPPLKRGRSKTSKRPESLLSDVSRDSGDSLNCQCQRHK